MIGYCVSIIDGQQKALLFGPLNTHEEALAMVPHVRKIGNEIDPKSHFYGWGTASVTVDPPRFLKDGSLNTQVAAQVELPGNACPVDIARKTLAPLSCGS